MLKRPLTEPASMAFEKELGLIFPDPEPPINTTQHSRISVCEPSIGPIEHKYVGKVMGSGWISSLGPEVKKYEAEFAERIGSKYAISCSNGTAALHLAVAALGIGPGDEVIMPTFTMIATINAVLYCGATPVLVDCDSTLNMNPNHIESKITENTKAILVVHIYGVPCAMSKINQIAKRHNLWVVEDVAESHGAKYDGKVLGSIGDIGTFSSYANKMFTTGEGGMITTSEPELADRVRTLMNHSFSPERHFCHRLFGFNYRLTALQAAVGRAQISRWDELIGNRLRMRDRYIKNLSDDGIIHRDIMIPNVVTPHHMEPVCWMFGVMVNRTKKNKVRWDLAMAGIETRNFFVPMHLQPVHYGRFRPQRFPIAESTMEMGFYLPSSSTLKSDDIDYVSEQLIKAVSA